MKEYLFKMKPAFSGKHSDAASVAAFIRDQKFRYRKPQVTEAESLTEAAALDNR